MKNFKPIYIIGSAVLVIILATGCGTASNNPGNNNSGNNGAGNNNGGATNGQGEVSLTLPAVNQTISSPLILEGKARGSWYFEASFPVELIDNQGKVLARSYVMARSDWMTADFVPFRGELTYTASTTAAGKLVLKNDNPSGLPENEKKVEVPVIISATDISKVKAFFNNNNLDPEVSCNKVFPVERSVPKTAAVARAALEELLKGPTNGEKNNGYFTSINPGVKIQSLTIANGTAKVDFSDTLERAVGGSCRVAAIRAQITETLKQFPTVKNVTISINGRTEDILQP